MDFYNFIERLEFILAGRKVNPWAKRLNLSSGTASRLKQNIVPGHDVLTAIMRTENASLNWLLSGSGKPFMIDNYLDGADFHNQLNNHAKDCPQYRCDYMALAQLNLMCVVLSQPASYEFKGALIEYVQVEIILSSIAHVPAELSNPKSAIDLGSYLSTRFENSNELTLDPYEIRALISGRLGTYLLFGDDTRPGLLNRS